MLTALAIERGVAGLVIDGAVRDSQDIIASGFPVFARGLSIKGTTKVVPGKVNVPVTVGGVVVEPVTSSSATATGWSRAGRRGDQRAGQVGGPRGQGGTVRAADPQQWRDHPGPARPAPPRLTQQFQARVAPAFRTTPAPTCLSPRPSKGHRR